jgi:arylsulfatase A
LLPLFADPTSRLERDAIHWHFPHYHHDRPASAIRERNWKLIEYLDNSGDIELYNLSKDIGEAHNLVNQHPGKVADLTVKLKTWRTKVIARMPMSNPGYDPQRAHQWWSRHGGKPIDSDSRRRFPQTEKDM